MAAAALIAALLETVAGYHADPLHGLFDPDSYMRLVRIRDGLASGWFTNIVAADNAGHGTVIYWSHLLDGIILLLRIPLLPFMDGKEALLVAGAATGPLFAAMLAAALVWAPAPLIDQAPRWRWLWTAPLAGLLSPALVTYGLMGYVHYHLLLVVIALLAVGCAGRAAAGRTGPAVWCGLLAAADIWLSPESLPYVLMAMGAVGVSWCLRPAAMGRPLRACGTAFLAGMALAILVDPPNGGRLAPEPDRVSVVYGVLALLVCGLTWLSGAVQRVAASVWGRSCAYLALCVCIVGVWLLVFPAITKGLAGLIPPEDVAAYFNAIAEMQAVPASFRGLLLLAPGIAAALVAAGLAWRRSSLLWAYAAACGLATAVLAAQHIRFLGYAEAAAAAMLPVALAATVAVPALPSRQAVLRRAALAFFLLPPLLPPSSMADTGGGTGKPTSACRVRDIAPVLDAAGNAVVLTEINDTPEILWRSHVATVGSLYHRSIGAFMRARGAWRSGPSATVPEAVLATGATDILACDSAGRSLMISDLPASTLQDRLSRHDVPGWLHEVGHAGGYYLYRISK